MQTMSPGATEVYLKFLRITTLPFRFTILFCAKLCAYELVSARFKGTWVTKRWSLEAICIVSYLGGTVTVPSAFGLYQTDLD